MAKTSERPARTRNRLNSPQAEQTTFFPADWSDAWIAMYQMGQPIRAGEIRIEAESSTLPTGGAFQNIVLAFPIAPSGLYLHVHEPTNQGLARWRELLDWLRDIAEDTSLPNANKTVGQARKAWGLISAVMDHLIPVPSASAGPDGEILFVWNRGNYHLELEILPDGPAEFFYRNRATHEVWDAEYQIGKPLSLDTLAKLYLFKAL
jgi:hypothetical protein